MLVLAVSSLGINSAPAISFDHGDNLPDLHDCVIALLSRGPSKSTFWTTELFKQSTLFGGRSPAFPANDRLFVRVFRDNPRTRCAIGHSSRPPITKRWATFEELLNSDVLVACLVS